MYFLKVFVAFYNQYLFIIQWSVDLRGMKLFEHAMKVAERIFEHRIRQQTDIDGIQF